MNAPVETPKATEQDIDADGQIGHWMCTHCQGKPVMGVVYRTFCGVLKRYQGGRPDLPWCAVCAELRRYQCERCGR